MAAGASHPEPRDKETVSGAPVPSRGLLPIISQRSGIVSNVDVEEGAKVREGDPIVSVSVDSVIDTGESTGAALSAVRATGAREKAINYKLGTRFNLVAQSAGQVTWLQAKPGATVSAGRTLGVMMPEGSQLLAELWVPWSASPSSTSARTCG